MQVVSFLFLYSYINMKQRTEKKIATYRIPKDLPHVHSGYLDIDLMDGAKAKKLVEGLNLNKIISVGPLDAYRA
jgi:hypothetical protein